ncbi:MAG: ATP-binding protein [Bacteroidales bacterium]|nr:ATP-binding protein [Candidatus Colimorpha onthohippi]
MLKRKFITTLEEWRRKGCEKAIIICGARQVGKTTIVREFAKRNYQHFVEINFVRTPIAMQAFEGELSSNVIFTNLSAMGFGPFYEGTTLVFFDEIQECPKARTAIKFLVEEHRYDIIESGSLLGINYKSVPSYPVGFEEEHTLFPLDFEEFLWAKGITEEAVGIVRKAYHDRTPVPEFIHQQFYAYYRQYLVVGGMPEAVQRFVTSSDFGDTLKVQRSVMTSYRADITNYAARQATLVKRIFDAIPSELGRQDKRFILANIERGASLRKYEDPTQWVVDAGLAYYSFNTSAFELPFEVTENHRLYKLYLVDTGLLCCQSLPGMQFQVMNGEIDINEGALTENSVACALIANGHTLHYYDKKSKQELDFIIAEGTKISILEVKSGDNYMRHASLDAARRDWPEKIARSIVLCKGNLAVKDDILYLPLYMAMFI